MSSAQPVGKKASKLTKMSPTVRLRKIKSTAMVTTNPMKRNNFRSLNISWKSALNLFLPMDTTCKSYVFTSRWKKC